jgi:hypothetical protein
MPKNTKFHERRTHEAGNQRVDTGFRRSELTFRIHRDSDRPFALTLDEAYDLANALDAALDAQEEDPLT